MGTALMTAKKSGRTRNNSQDEEKEELVDSKKLRELAVLIEREAQRLNLLANKMETMNLPPIKAMTGKFHSLGLGTLRNFAGRQVIAKLLSETLDAGKDIDELLRLSPPKSAHDS